ncbi:MAG: glycosyl transferase, partial [Comamonas sp.]|nr:glycosyl transferase [Comamonas sp.]
LGVGSWQTRDGVLLCLRGPLSTAQSATNCDLRAQQWLAGRGQSAQPHVLQVARSGWRFPRAQPWVYAVYDVQANERP